MKRWCLALVVVLVGLLRSVQAFAEEPSAKAPTFDQLVKQGDQALAARRWAEAATAYHNASTIQNDLTVTGRLGLALLELGQLSGAANQLHRVIEEPSAAKSPAERKKFLEAYDKARGKVCRIDVELDQTGARIALDGRELDKASTDIWFFAKPGIHEIRVRLDGFEDATKQINAEPGGRLSVAFVMKRKAIETPLEKPSEPRVEIHVIREPAPLPPPVAPSASSSPRAMVALGLGASMVFGATPGAALGPQIFGAWRPREWAEVGLDLRAAWSLAKLDRYSDMQLVTWSVTIAPCGRWRGWLFGCLLSQIDGLVSDDVFGGEFNRSALGEGVLLGLGVRAGVEFVARGPLRVQAWGDVVAHQGRFQPFVVDDQDWQGSPVTGSLGLRSVVVF